jgi:hypothetical protein
MAIALISRGLLRARLNLRRRRISEVSPFVRGNLLAEARNLNRAGYTVAAVITARVAVERSLRQLSFTHPDWRHGDAGIRCYLSFLLKVGIMDRHTSDQIEAFSKKANSVCHGAFVNRLRAWIIIQHAARVTAMLKGGAL